MVIGLLLPTLLLLINTVALKNSVIDVADLELQGLPYAQAVADTIAPLAEHRGMQRMVNAGDQSRVAELNRIAARVDEEFVKLKAEDAKVDEVVRNTENLQSIANDWQQLKEQGRSLSPSEN